MNASSYGKIERQVEAYGEYLRRIHPESPEEKEAWQRHTLHVRSGQHYRDKCEAQRKGDHQLFTCTCRSFPGFDAWATEEKRLGAEARAFTYPRLEAIRKAMDRYRDELKRKAELVGRLKLGRQRHEHLK